MNRAKWLLKASAWFIYFVIVFEFILRDAVRTLAPLLYLPLAQLLSALGRESATAWLTRFYLPTFSRTGNAALDALCPVSLGLLILGGALFLASAVPLYASKLLRRGMVTGGLYRSIRHPQYVALALAGLGAVLHWPRFLALVTCAAMLSLYYLFARWDEAQCLRAFGEAYCRYRERTGMFLPRSWERRLSRRLPSSRAPRLLAGLGAAAAFVAGAVWLGDALRRYSLDRVVGLYDADTAVLSPARLGEAELRSAYRAAAAHPSVASLLQESGPGERKTIVYVVPREWRLADQVLLQGGGHWGCLEPGDFDRRRLRVLFARPRSRSSGASGRAILETASGLDPVLTAEVDLERSEVTGIEKPPAHVRWGDVSMPTF